MELAPLTPDSKPREAEYMKKSSDRVRQPHAKAAPGRLRVERDASPDREPVPDYFTVFLLQELLSSIGWRHKH
jgi:hypothetical protein